MMPQLARAALTAAADRERAAPLQSYFKAAPGQYGEGDVVIGEMVPALQGAAGGAR